MDYHLTASLAATQTGLDTLAKIKEISPQTRIIMFTSVEYDHIIKQAKEKGASDYVIKGPKAFDEVKSILDRSYNLS